MIYTRLSLYFFILLYGFFIASHAAQAGDLVQWHTTNIQALRGNHYEVGPKKERL